MAGRRFAGVLPGGERGAEFRQPAGLDSALQVPVEAVWMRDRYVPDDRMRDLMARHDAAAAAHYAARGLAGRTWTGGLWPDRVGSTQSNMSMPRRTAPTMSAGLPTPIR